MDGNGRWGLRKKKSRNLGHKAGLNTVEKIIRETIKKKIRFLTLYAFSTENWRRPKKEVIFLFNLLNTVFVSLKNNIFDRVIECCIFGKPINPFLPPIWVAINLSYIQMFDLIKILFN